jgi:4-hydroxyphenylpyruvate dioxygenase
MNPVGISGIEWVEFASRDPQTLHELFLELGFSRVMEHAERKIDLYRQGDITFLLNRDPRSYAASFEKAHGPCIASMAWRTTLAPEKALGAAVERGAEAMKGDYAGQVSIRGIGDSLIYFTPVAGSAEGGTARTAKGCDARFYAGLGFTECARPDRVREKGFVAIDHLTNNIEKGKLAKWSSFYKDVFGFTEVRYFDIRGVKTGLKSYALRSPDGSFCIPINEGTEAKSQINEYLEEYNGPGIQHLAFLTKDILASLRALDGTKHVGFLDIDAEYYRGLRERFPRVKEDLAEIEERNVLVDGDAEGYLLQIFTKNLVGPIFIEMIQRENHLSFGEGNFGALFRSIERDQAKRGYLTA